MQHEDKYKYRGISLYKIRNRNELRVINLLPKILDEFDGYDPDTLDIEDIYALVLNKVPPRYAQIGSIVLREELSDGKIEEAIRDAVRTVMGNPKH
ncbi:MAG: late competence development ComFB family protein [SAR324 cluster bacterium]|nr:late competence development ComFB family protein [SAR324 cluster bacterium]MBF0353330.1 late competence development ComFB family protein [SAR324 cluster bacterium]